MFNLMTIDLKRLVVYLFIFLVVVSFVKLISRPSNMGVFEKKVFGAATVFMVALVADNTWVYSISFFIGGLIIATENFLIHLAGIFKSDKEHVSDITRYYFEKLSPAETEQKLVSDAAETLEEEKRPNLPTTKKEAGELNKRVNTTISSIRHVEAEVLRTLAGRVASSTKPLVIKEHVRVAGEDYVKTFDAIVTNVYGDKSIYAGVEIKYFARYKIEKVKSYFRKEANAYSAYKTLFVIVFEKLTQAETNELVEFRRGLVSRNHGIGIVLAKINHDKGVEYVHEMDLDAFFPRRDLGPGDRYAGGVQDYSGLKGYIASRIKNGKI